MRKLVLVAATAVMIFALPAANAAVTENLKEPLVDFVVFIPCADGGAGEDVELNGDLHVLLTFTINGNNVSGKLHFQPQGISGVGMTTGAKYRGTGVTQEHFKAPVVPDGSADTFTFVNNFRIIGQGRGNNFLLHAVFHVTVNANGEVMAEVDLSSEECK